MATRTFNILFYIVAAGAAVFTHRTHAQPADGALDRCERLGHAEFSAMLDAPTQVIEAKQEPGGEALPGNCRVSGYVTPNVEFLLRLPLESWNGKLIELGCGGFCGGYSLSACDDPLRMGYACVVSDFGHRATSVDAKWAYNNTQAEADYGYRGVRMPPMLRQPVNPSEVEFTRPVFPYPAVAKYRGYGNSSEAANFVPATP